MSEVVERATPKARRLIQKLQERPCSTSTIPTSTHKEYVCSSSTKTAGLFTHLHGAFELLRRRQGFPTTPSPTLPCRGIAVAEGAIAEASLRRSAGADLKQSVGGHAVGQSFEFL